MKKEIKSEVFIQRCFDLALRGGKKVRPNPMVGAVLVYKDRIIGEGYHAFFGGPHAEVNCLKSVKDADRKLISFSTLYVSLEPCNYFGKTPACTNLILENKIPEVVIATTDPNPEVDGKGLQLLTDNGVKVQTNILKEQGDDLIKYFKVNHLQKRPYIILKIVKSKDNFIGKTGKKIWISNEHSSLLSHKWRTEVDGIMVGTNTIMNDDPKLNNRLYPGTAPSRIILDRTNKIPADFNVKDNSNPTYFINNSIQDLSNPNEMYYKIDFDQKDFLKTLMEGMFEKGIFVLLVEGGSKLIQSFLSNNLWDEARVISSSKLLESGIRAPNITGILKKKVNLGTDQLQIILPLE